MGIVLSKLSKGIGAVIQTLLRIWFILTFILTISLTSITLRIVDLVGRLLMVSKEKRNGWCALLAGIWFHILLVSNPQIRIESYDGKPLPWDELFAPGKPAPFILINHTSQLDAFVFSAALPMSKILKMRTLAKSGLFNLPVFGAIIKLCGHFPVYFNSSKLNDFAVDKEAQNKVMEDVTNHVKAGGGLSLYPEGQINRSDARILQDFRRGSLKMARDHGMELWTFLHSGVHDAWPHDSPTGGFSSTIKVKLVKIPDLPSDMDIAEFSDSIRTFMQRELDLMEMYEGDEKTPSELAMAELALLKAEEEVYKEDTHIGSKEKSQKLNEIRKQEAELEQVIKAEQEQGTKKKTN